MMGVMVPDAYGGSGLSYIEYVTIIQEIAKVCGGVGLSLAAHNSLCTGHILHFGSEAQKQQYLPGLASGQHLGAWGQTEANTGSDAGNMRCTALREGDEWILNGTKNWITHGRSGDIAVVIARTGEPRTKDNATAFVIERGTPGFSGGKKENKLGMRASETAEMIFDQCRISDANRLGQVGEGFKQALKVLDGGRISIAALSLGIAKGALDAALQYSKERHQFDQPICNFQGISFKLADMATEIAAAELLTLQAADLKNKHLPMTKQAAMAKYYASEVAVRVSTEAVQIFGGYGYTKDFPVEKFYRDSKLCTIGEGTSEIQKLVIAREVLKG
jgi:alkylation response protein AidB-like acyl-CoA dehydrogenase